MEERRGRRDFLGRMTVLAAASAPVVSTLWSTPARANPVGQEDPS